MQNFLKNWREEKNSVFLYGKLSELESGTIAGKLFSELALEAAKQAEIWAIKIRKQGGNLPPYHPNLRTRFVVSALKLLGVQRMKPVLAAMKVRGLSIYDKSLIQHPIPKDLEEVGKRHRSKGGGGVLRAAIFGINDGLVSNASLIMGIAGASDNVHWIILSGIAGLLAGAFSMGAGEYLSMRSQREMFEHQINLEREELREYPTQEAAELALIYRAKGLSEQEADQLANKLIEDPDRALDTLAREELGLNPDDLGSPWGACFSSFIFFSIGAIIPLLPFLFSNYLHPVLFSAILTGCALFLVGAVMGFLTGRNLLWAGLRMLIIGAAAGAATFWIGKILGVGIS